MVDSGVEAGKIYKVNLEYLVVLENKEVLDEWMNEACLKDTGFTWKSSQWLKLEQFEQQNKKR